MQVARFIQHKVRPYPTLYNILIRVYSIALEIKFFFHALLKGKLFFPSNKHQFSSFISKQEILTYPFIENHFNTTDDFRKWLENNDLQFAEGGWTFYIPPQEGLYRCFNFLKDNYPPNAGIKILKDFLHPNEARYTNHKQNPAYGASLKRALTPSPLSLLKVANYLYANGLGIRVYDLVALKCKGQFLTCYITQHLEDPHITLKDYQSFMNRLESILAKGEITTIHESTDIMWDFTPPDCHNNLMMDPKGKSLYVDFQGFLLCNEEKLLTEIIHDIKDKVHFGGVRFFRGGQKYLYQAIPGLSIGKRDMETRWLHFLEMAEEGGCSFQNRTVYDIGCNTGLMLYHTLSAGSLWGLGWDLPEVTESAERLLLALGATRFDLFGGRLTEETDFISRVPDRYKTRKDGMLLFLAVSDHIGFPKGISELPWEYMFYEGHANQDYDMSLKRLQGVPWLKNAEIITHRTFADGDTPKRVIMLLKRQS
jgi:hypothetical protein